MKTKMFTKLIMMILASMVVLSACAPAAIQQTAIVAQPVGLQTIAQSLALVAQESSGAEVFINQAGDIYTVTANGSKYVFSHWNHVEGSFAGFRMDGLNANTAYKSIKDQGYVLAESIKDLPMAFQVAVAKASIFGARCLVALSELSASAMFGIMIVDENGAELQVPAVKYREYTDT